jgi:peptide/nickel transport system ATP-binding protein
MGDSSAVPLLAVEGLGIEFRTRSGTVRAVDGIGFELHRGETMALVGESGSGKSVTAYAVMGILDAAARITSGQIMFGGLELLQAGEKAVAEIRGRELAIIFQSPRTALNPIRPVGKQIADILLRHGNVTAAQAPGRAIEIAGKSAYSRSGAARAILSVRVVGRHVSASHDCDGACM